MNFIVGNIVGEWGFSTRKIEIRVKMTSIYVDFRVISKILSMFASWLNYCYSIVDSVQ